MKLKVEFREAEDNFDAELAEESGEFEADFGSTTTLHDGQNGATFIPSVSAEGVLSWTNDRELPNPEPINIKGPTPVKGKDYFDGAPGVSATHKWDGTVLSITSASGTSSADLKGRQGDPGKTPVKGIDYFDGEPGYTPVKGVDYFDGKDGYTPVKGKDYLDGAPGVSATHKWDGTVLSITSASGTSSADLKGRQGDPGKTPVKGIDYFDGEPGYTPVKGQDYFTEADKAEMVSAVIAALPNAEGVGF